MLDYATNNIPLHPMQTQVAVSVSWEGSALITDNWLIITLTLTTKWY